jgi:rhamnogalacturonyl hydrolase YesR
MKPILYSYIALALLLPAKAASAADSVNPVAVQAIMKKVADWQLAATPGQGQKFHEPTDWTMGALYVGMMEWAKVSGEARHLDYLKGQCQKSGWKLGPKKFHADDHAVGALYLSLYQMEKEPLMIRALNEQFDAHLKNPPDNDLNFTKPGCQNRWAWCDSLFMSPPVWAGLSAVTGDRKYLDYMDREWWATTGYLYDKEERLFYRDSRFFDKREANGRKVFWGRGNGWVLAGTARVLRSMPKDYPSREKYVVLFKEMAEKIASLQQPDGLWRASLLDPASYPVKETSASGFFCYGLAWGINNGLLDRSTYTPHVLKAWNALGACVHPDGKLGNVQPIGEDPKKVTDEMTEVYGVGAFLLAGCEVLELLKN